MFSLKVGDCLTDDTSSGATVTDTGVVDCTQPHASEVYADSTVPDGDGTYPGDAAITSQAETDCVAAFTTFDGRAYSGSDLTITYLVPTDSSWAGGDREILCLVSAPTGTNMGSLEGSNR